MGSGGGGGMEEERAGKNERQGGRERIRAGERDGWEVGVGVGAERVRNR